uniref:Hypothetical_protein n=1 Tax=Oryza brachyantha TaxID=4533 RepID=G2XMC8_ORYBR|nr:hypothetical_protein [Oryza brachyantha]
MHTVPPPPAASSSHGEDFAEVVVVRHGETAGNALRIIQNDTCWFTANALLVVFPSIFSSLTFDRASRSFSQGHMDIELNETGKQQAVMSELGVASYEYLKLGLVVTWKVARRLANEAKPAAVYSSDLKRAADTAQTIATACNVSYLVLNPALRERHMGDLHGLKFDDAVRSKPDAYKAFTSEDRSQEIPGGGESLDQLSDRCVSYLNTIASKHKGERVIVVTHGASIEELCRHADPTSSVPRRIPNTSICVFHISGTTGHWILERFGDVAHLMEVSFPKTAFGGDGASA